MANESLLMSSSQTRSRGVTYQLTAEEGGVEVTDKTVFVPRSDALHCNDCLRSSVLSPSGRYQPAELVVTENGMSMKGENDMPLAQALQDTQRVNFYRDYIAEATLAVNVDKVRRYVARRRNSLHAAVGRSPRHSCRHACKAMHLMSLDQ